MHLAVNSGDPQTVRECLQRGAKVETMQENKSTALHFACAQGNVAIVRILHETYLKNMEEGAMNIMDFKDVLNMTPLHRAALYDHSKVVNYLLTQVSLNLNDLLTKKTLLYISSKLILKTQTT